MRTDSDVSRSKHVCTFTLSAFSLRVALALPLLAAPGLAHAAEEALSLNKAIERAVAGNPDLRRERITIESSDARLESARGFFDVNLTADVNYSSRKQPSLNMQDLQGGATKALSLEAGIQRQLETGGNLSLGVSSTKTTSGAALACATTPGIPQECVVYDSSVGLRFTQPLLRGLGPEFALANVHRNQILKDQALLNRLTRASSVMRDVINIYWGLSYATQDLAIRQSAVDLAREQLRVTKAQIDVGRLAPVDAAAVEAAIGDRMQDVLLSQQELLFRTLELRRAFGLSFSPSDPAFTAADVPQASPQPITVASDVLRALEANPQLRSLKLGIALTEVDIATAQNALRPQLDFIGTIGAAGRNLGQGYDDSFKQVAGVDNLTWNAGLHFALPVQNRVAGGQERLARWTGERAKLEAGDFDKEIRFQVARLSSNIDSAGKRLELAKATVGYANQNLEAEKARFSVGRSTNNEVLRVQQALKTAEIQVVRATVDLLIGQTNLRALTGDLLETYRITLKGM
jgi:outer membrane protein